MNYYFKMYQRYFLVMSELCWPYTRQRFWWHLTKGNFLTLLTTHNNFLTLTFSIHTSILQEAKKLLLYFDHVMLEILTSKILPRSSATQGQSCMYTPISLTCVRERQSELALPMYMCVLSISQNLVCRIPPPTSLVKFKLRT